MTSRTQSQRLRAARTRTPPARRPAGRRASRRVLGVAAAVLVLAAGSTLLALAVADGGSSGGSVPRRGSLANALPGAEEVARLYKGIPQHGRVLGRSSAPVTMVEYVDLQCPYCRQFAVTALPDLVTRYVRSDTLKVELRRIAFLGPDSERGRRAVLAAGEQGRLFNLVDLLYYNQGSENSGWLSDRLVRAAAASVPGLDVPALVSAASSDSANDELRELDELAGLDEVRGTPTVFVGKSGGRLSQVRLQSADDAGPVRAAIADALA